MNNDKKSLYLLVVVGLLVFIRVVFDKNNYLTYIVAVINIAAYSFVFSSIVVDSMKGIEERIKKTGVPVQVIDRTCREVRVKIGFIFVVLLLMPIIITLFKCSSLKNDLLSILALGLSILDDEISEWIIMNYPLSSKK